MLKLLSALRAKVWCQIDEPTSGLDSQTAWSICMLLRKLADNGQAILVTIHQPSSQLFQIFDHLLLLGKTGKMLYFGDIRSEPSTLIGYFERHGATACGSGQNPAEWILDVTGCSEYADTSQTLSPEDWCEFWARSSERQEVLHHFAGLKKNSGRYRRLTDCNSERSICGILPAPTPPGHQAPIPRILVRPDVSVLERCHLRRSGKSWIEYPTSPELEFTLPRLSAMVFPSTIPI
jgi:ABC-2 type transporter